ncbi:MAG: 30S ribosomal protein S6 [Cytophagales bacterium]
MAVTRFETIFIMTPVLSEQQMKETVERYLAFLKENKAKVIHEENWGLRKLAYPIQHKSTGFYQLVEFECEGSMIESLEVEFSRDEAIMRFLTVKLDNDGIKYNERRREKQKNLEQKKAEIL